ncbi:MAG: type 4a pilus biogenesis protein PilO [Candidatus Aenigmatarchaeota archaeon]
MILSQSAISPSSNYLIRKVFIKTDTVTYIQTLLLSFIQELCQINNITMLHFEFNEPSVYDKVSEITISIKLEGQPSNIVNFLKNLETYHKIIDIKSFELLADQSMYSSTIVLTTYRIEDVY